MHFPQLNILQFKLFSVLLSLLLLSGCGFHLKQHDGLADKYPQIYLKSNDPNGDLTRFVKIRLRGAGIKIVTTPSEEIATLTLEGERRTSRTISLNVRAQNAEQELGYNLNYSLQSPGQESRAFSVNLYRDFLASSSQALAKSREEELLEKELRTIAADHIITTMLSIKTETATQANQDNE